MTLKKATLSTTRFDMNKYIFKNEFSSNTSIKSVTELKFEGETLEDVIIAFKGFLISVGYTYSSIEEFFKDES